VARLSGSASRPARPKQISQRQCVAEKEVLPIDIMDELEKAGVV